MKLESKNIKLMHEIKRIDSIMNAPPPKTRYGVQIPETSSGTMNQELTNAYKQIKVYEYEVNKVKCLKDSGTYV